MSEKKTKLKPPWYHIDWHIYSLPIIFVVFLGFLLNTFLVVNSSREIVYANSIKQDASLGSLVSVRRVRSDLQEFLPDLIVLREGIVGLSTTQIDILSDQLSVALIDKDYSNAHDVVDSLSNTVELLKGQQDVLAEVELARLRKALTESLHQMDVMLIQENDVADNALEVLDDTTADTLSRIRMAREWLQSSAVSIKERKIELGEVAKTIVINKAERMLYMYEDDVVVYNMPVSLGRYGWPTRSGDYTILDKLGTVWSVWNIWLPNWMGIYFAGSSENGIHGLPFDNYGHTYWKTSIGKADITYGCVMPDDPDMEKLYNWSDVGTPVKIIDK
ncbi:L,D-transpeptidase [candidate division WWE3 bacterium]|uniref:L,D-transpeptidase n=1 Tax=candidate division WWE3 bacterium TaxID=2053526 RepID=A0A955RQW7_UNCKA|nr:L,D-transpeptidase [candidate division WWE3 bacterium]